MKKSLAVLSVLLGSVLLLSNFTIRMDAAKPFHTPAELASLKSFAQTPIGPGEYFLPSSSCQGCHGFDTLFLANIDENGMDVNLFDRWESSMMAFSAKDPLWRAKVSHEIMINPGHADELQTSCTSCHAPMGHYTAIYGGATSYTIADLVNDSLGLDGVSCAGCHTIGPDAGSTFSGITSYDTTRNIYGPFTVPFVGPMQLYEGYTPVYSPHMDNSAVCSSCHTIFTKTVDFAGNYTGTEFPEQATYHEFLNSSFPVAGISCQTCHMPQLTDPIVIANGYINLQGRTPFNQHVFAGANHFMLDLIKSNKSSLNIDVEDEHFDSSMAATMRMLQQQAVEFELFSDSIASDTAYYRVKIKNKAGHKFPSGYPSRRAVLQLVMTDATNDTIFQSGIFDPEYRVVGENAQFEIHHDIISQDHVSQIYEMVMGDVNAQYTSILERASVMLKDNRIPPDGFTTTAPMYDTVMITPDAVADDNFNKINSVEGSGTDFVHFRIPVTGINGLVNVNASLFYQSVAPKFLDEMFSLNSAPIDTFEVMYNAADKSPILVASDSLTDIISGIPGNNTSATLLHIWPSLVTDGWVNITSSTNQPVSLYEVVDRSGKIILTGRISPGIFKEKIRLPDKSGIYFINVKSESNSSTTKILRL